MRTFFFFFFWAVAHTKFSILKTLLWVYDVKTEGHLSLLLTLLTINAISNIIDGDEKNQCFSSFYTVALFYQLYKLQTMLCHIYKIISCRCETWMKIADYLALFRLQANQICLGVSNYVHYIT